MLPLTGTDLHKSLLLAEEREAGEAFQQLTDEEKKTTSTPLIVLQRAQLQQLTAQEAVDHKPLPEPPIQNDFQKFKTLSPKLQKFLQELGITETELEASDIEIDVLDQIINKSLGGQLLRWLALESWMAKFLQFPLLDERGIQEAEIIPESQGCCNQLREWKRARVWPKAISVPFKSETMLRRAYGISEFFAGAGTFIMRIWTLLLLTFLGNDLYYYYAFPDERYDTTLTSIFLHSQKMSKCSPPR